MGEDVRNLTSEPPNGLHCRILVVEEKENSSGFVTGSLPMLAGTGG